MIEERISVLDAQIVEKQAAIEDKQAEIDATFELIGSTSKCNSILQVKQLR